MVSVDKQARRHNHWQASGLNLPKLRPFISLGGTLSRLSTYKGVLIQVDAPTIPDHPKGKASLNLFAGPQDVHLSSGHPGFPNLNRHGGMPLAVLSGFRL
jgi:hypothetical protein